MRSISILDYGLGNTGSVLRMIEKVGGTAIKISTPEEIKHAEKIILPGVGHFDHGMHLLREKELVTEIQAVAKKGMLILGICLGMQLLFDSSSIYHFAQHTMTQTISNQKNHLYGNGDAGIKIIEALQQ